MSGPVVIVGAGQAGLQIAESLRQEKFDGPITLLGTEPHAPYNRPPVSIKWLLERPDIATLAIRVPEALQRRHVAPQPTCNVTGIVGHAAEVGWVDGASLAIPELSFAG